MNYAGMIVATLTLALVPACRRHSPPLAQPKQIDPCQQIGISYSPVGRIVRMNQMPLKDHRDYGTHALIDASGNLQWILQSPKMNLDSFAGDGKWYRIDGQRSPDHPDLFIVCALAFSQ